MPEETKKQPDQKPAPESKIKSMDTTKAHIKAAYLEPIAKKRQAGWHSGEVLKLAFIAMAADCAGLEKGPDRAKFFAQMDATPGWFGSGNPSACRQAYEAKGTLDEVAADYSAL